MHLERTPHAWARAANPLLAAACAGGLAAGCSQFSSDFSNLNESIFPPTPGEAARWAADFTNAENQRRGVMLLGNATFGGERQYVDLYTMYLEQPTDPLVRAAAIQALARHTQPSGAVLIARQLESPYAQVRLAAAKGLQRVHDPTVAEAMWKCLVDPDEDHDVRVELAIALGQYPRDDVFHALCDALGQRDLAVNLAAADSLRLLTAQDYGVDPRLWLNWYASASQPFRREVPYYFPTFQRALGFWDYLTFWTIPTFEEPGVPAGMAGSSFAPVSGGSSGSGGSGMPGAAPPASVEVPPLSPAPSGTTPEGPTPTPGEHTPPRQP